MKVASNKTLRFSILTGLQRGILGFLFGLIVMATAVQVFVVNSFDFDNMAQGVETILKGINPWAPQTRVEHFYNPPFSVIFLWPMLFTTPKFWIILGGASLMAVVFYLQSWVALTWFITNSMLWLIAAGGIDMFVIGGGLVLLYFSERNQKYRMELILRVLSYGLLMVKPQGGFFIVFLYVLLYRDWRGLLLSCLVYGVVFLPLYPDWLKVVIQDPPLAQTQAAHTLMGKFGWMLASVVAILVLLARRWKFWQLGGALAGILMPYGMPGLPIFLVLTSISRLAVIPVVVIFSGALAAITWVDPPFPVANIYDWINPLMSIYHVSMLGLVLIMACLLPGINEQNVEGGRCVDLHTAFYNWLSQNWRRIK